MGDRLLNFLLRDFEEFRTMNRFAVQNAAFAQHLQKVPGDCLTLAVRVSGQIERIGLFHCPDDHLDLLFAALCHRIVHAEVVRSIDRSVF